MSGVGRKVPLGEEPITEVDGLVRDSFVRMGNNVNRRP